MSIASGRTSGTTGSPDLVLEDGFVITMDPRMRVFERGRVEITDGLITHVGEAIGPVPEASEVRRLNGDVVLPGFVNTHAHLVSSLSRGLGRDRFLVGLDPSRAEMSAAVRGSIDEAAAYAGARLALAELIRSGVTTTTDSQVALRGEEGASDGTLRAMTESGMRCRFYRASVNRTSAIAPTRYDAPSLAFSELTRLSERWTSELVSVGAEALTVMRVDRPLMEALIAWASGNGGSLAMHLSYSREAERYPIDAYGERLMPLLGDWGALDLPFLGHHPVWLDDGELDIAADFDVGFSLCASANMLLGLQAAPLRDIRRRRIRLGLGTDQPNDGHNMFEVMKSTLLQQRSKEGDASFGTAEMMLHMATIGGARALRMDHRIGSIEVGKAADMVMLDSTAPALNPPPGRVSNIVLAASPGEVSAVCVGGRFVLEGGSLVDWDLEGVVHGANQAVERILRSSGLESGPVHSFGGL